MIGKYYIVEVYEENLFFLQSITYYDAVFTHIMAESIQFVYKHDAEVFLEYVKKLTTDTTKDYRIVYLKGLETC